MTIGIAAYGPRAGEAIIKALAAVEAFGRGAIKGFVSCAALQADGFIIRAETQRGGSAALFDAQGDVRDAVLHAGAAVLMSSGPDRPGPLSQFTPGRRTVGLVTGHRMPHLPGTTGEPLNERVADLMVRGLSPRQAVSEVIAANPTADAGLIALAADGRLFLADTPAVAARPDRGSALSIRDDGLAAAVIHNAIFPHRPIASLALEIAFDVMIQPAQTAKFLTLPPGLPLILGQRKGVKLNSQGVATHIMVDDSKLLSGSWSLGLGFEAAVDTADACESVMLSEPFILVQDGVAQSYDGQFSLVVPYLAQVDVG